MPECHGSSFLLICIVKIKSCCFSFRAGSSELLSTENRTLSSVKRKLTQTSKSDEIRTQNNNLGSSNESLGPLGDFCRSRNMKALTCGVVQSFLCFVLLLLTYLFVLLLQVIVFARSVAITTVKAAPWVPAKSVTAELTKPATPQPEVERNASF